MDISKLPAPDSEELRALVENGVTRDIYAALYANMDKSLSISEIRSLLGLVSGEQEHLNRRLRDLYGAFEIERTRRGRDTLYRLVSRAENPHQTAGRISAKVRAWILRDQRCKQCGRTPSEDKIKLHVDHIIPQEWGGTDAEENLQALCSECNEGKKNFYSSFNEFAESIKQAISYDEPHKRIGELLKAFNGKPVPSDLLEVVAKAKQYQDDWQKRMRELRELGWDYSFEKRREGSRVRTYYVLLHSESWPEGSIRAEIRRRELEKK
ncbi:MAG: HNH endonuclease signature motif containing protein [Patescibacteria group bacterium]